VLRSTFSFVLLALGAGAPARAAGEAAGIDGNATAFLEPARLATLPAPERASWTAYLERSRRLSAADHASMQAELRAARRARMTPAPYRKAFRVDATMTPAWFGGAEAARMADNLLTFQTPSGGWSKRTEVTEHPRQPGQSYYSENDGWHYIATIDNDSTTEELRFLAAAHAAHPEPRYRQAFARGLEYLFAAQLPNGCWPQVYPLEGGYHDAATHNDDAIVNVMRLLDDVAAGKLTPAPPEMQRRAGAAAARGLDCILATQVVVKGVRTVWAQQHDPLTLAPVAARSYELAGLCGRESASITAYLMSLPSPDERTVGAVHAAVAWFRQHRIFGYEYDGQNGLRAVQGAGPLWARLTEIATDRPIFANRDGVKRYDWNELTDRRRGYAWYGKEPEAVLASYDGWARQHPALHRAPPGR
jgi:PelA/Pel-15E family pectate lyase